MLLSVPMPKRPPGAQIVAQGEEPVAEIALGRGTKAGDGTRARQARGLVRLHVGRVHERPALAYGHVVEEPAHRARVGPSEAVAHLALLLGGMDVDRGAGIEAIEGTYGFRERCRRHGAQRVRGQAKAEAAARRSNAVEPLEEGCELLGSW